MDQKITVRTMTVNQTVERLRALGIKTSAYKVSDAIEKGVYPFGICVRNANNRRWFEIYVADFERWVAQRAQ